MDKKISTADLQAAMNDPMIKNSKPDQLISNLMGMFGMEDINPMDQDEIEKVRRIYFQVIRLNTDEWTPLPGVGNLIQISPFRLKEIPENCHIVADVLIDKSEYEVDCFNQYITAMDIRGKSLILHASISIPITITLGLKCVSNEDDTKVIMIEDENLTKASST